MGSTRGATVVSARMRHLVPALLALCLLAPAGAGAAIGASSVTVPADGLRVTSTDASTQAAVTGGSSGGAVGDPLSLRCFARPGRSAAVGSALVDDAAGAFSGTALLAATRGPCVLRALPVGFAVGSGDLAPFPGPLLTVEAQRTTTLGDGPNAGTAVNLDDWLQQGAAGVGLCSLGSFGLCGGRLFDAAARVSTEPVFNAGGWVGATTGSRSYVQVDGANAYPPFRAAQLAAGAPGLPGLTRATTREAGGGATVVEADPLVACNTAAFPPGPACTAFTATGVRLERTSTVTADGTGVEQHDVLVSTDGRAHTVSAYLGQNFLIDEATSPALRFGWLKGDTAGVRTTGTEIGGPTAGPATVYVAANAAAGDGDPVYAQGAVTFDRPPASVRVTAPTDLLVRFPDVRVPAGGRADLVRSSYVITRTAAEAAARALAREDQLVAPTVGFSSPRAGATVLTPTVTVTGTATDDQGLASLTVAGRPVTPAASGRFSVAVPVVKGANRIAAVAVDRAGNRTEATLQLTYQDRLPPAVGPLYIEPRVWRVGRPTTVRFALGEAGTLRLTASRVKGGRSRRGVCVPSTAALRRARARVCVRYVRLATTVEPRRAGGVRASIGPRLGGRTVPAGRVQLRVTVTDYARNVSRPRTLDLTLRPPLRRTPAGAGARR